MRWFIGRAVAMVLRLTEVLGGLMLLVGLLLVLGWGLAASPPHAPTEAEEQCAAALKAVRDSPVCLRAPPRALHWETHCQP
jgi:hypothetical protein